MTLPIYTSAAFSNGTGITPAAGASVEVRHESDNTLVTLYSDRAGTQQITNSLTNGLADADGRFQFFAAPDVDGWRIEVTDGVASHVLRYQQPMFAPSTVDTGTAPDQVPRNSDLRDGVERESTTSAAAYVARTFTRPGGVQAHSVFLMGREGSTDRNGFAGLLTTTEPQGTSSANRVGLLMSVVFGNDQSSASGTTQSTVTGQASGTVYGVRHIRCDFDGSTWHAIEFSGRASTLYFTGVANNPGNLEWQYVLVSAVTNIVPYDGGDGIFFGRSGDIIETGGTVTEGYWIRQDGWAKCWKLVNVDLTSTSAQLFDMPIQFDAAQRIDRWGSFSASPGAATRTAMIRSVVLGEEATWRFFTEGDGGADASRPLFLTAEGFIDD